MSNNSSIDKLAEQYSENESDARAYQKAQTATIIAQTKQINELRKKTEELSQQLDQLTIENTRLKALNPSEEFDTEDAETIAIVQLALLRNYAMQRELTLEECKKSEIYVKILKELRATNPKEKEENAGGLTNEQLLELMKTTGEA